MSMPPPEVTRAVSFLVVVVVSLGAWLLAVGVTWDHLATRSRKRLIDSACVVNTLTMAAFACCLGLLIWFRIGRLAMRGENAFVACVVLGLFLYAAGTALNLIARRQLGANWSNRISRYEDQTLVTGGLYGVVRHPLYSSQILVFLGVSLAYLNALALGLTILLFVPAMVYRAWKEEEIVLRAMAGYADYRRRVPMLFPLPRGRRR
jgi:protein-S-isoprenylcysteine O-methyltransferase Ste14